MGQKVHPHGLRVGVIKDWDSRWYAREDKVGDLVVEDYKIRQYLKKTLYSAGVPTIEIERDNAKVAMAMMQNTPKAGCELMIKVLKSAKANAENNFEMDPDNLYVCQTYVGAGPILKRGRPRAQGRMFRINKRTSHIVIAVAEKD